MGLFGKKKEDKNTSNKSEFERDISELLNRADIQSRNEISKIEFDKAITILNCAKNQDDIIRAYDLMGPLASSFEYLPAIMWMGDFAESAKHNIQEAAYWFKKAADKGEPNGARNYADLIMTGQIIESKQVAIEYYEIASNNGIAEAAFVLGEIMRNSGNKKKALEYYKKALDMGYTIAQSRINQMI